MRVDNIVRPGKTVALLGRYGQAIAVISPSGVENPDVIQPRLKQIEAKEPSLTR